MSVLLHSCTPEFPRIHKDYCLNSLTPCTLKHPMFIGWPGPTAAPCKTAPARPQNGPYGHPKRPFSQADGATPGKGLHHRQICKQAPPDSRQPRNTRGGTAECNRLHRFLHPGILHGRHDCRIFAEDKAALGNVRPMLHRARLQCTCRRQGGNRHRATRLATARPPSTRKESRPRQTGKPRPRPKAGPLQLKQTA